MPKAVPYEIVINLNSSSSYICELSPSQVGNSVQVERFHDSWVYERGRKVRILPVQDLRNLGVSDGEVRLNQGFVSAVGQWMVPRPSNIGGSSVGERVRLTERK